MGRSVNWETNLHMAAWRPTVSQFAALRVAPYMAGAAMCAWFGVVWVAHIAYSAMCANPDGLMNKMKYDARSIQILAGCIWSCLGKSRP